MVTKIVAKVQAAGNVRDLPKSGRPVPENTKLDVMLQVQDNPHSTTHQMGIDFNLSHTSVRNILHKQKFHPYKITLMQELSEDDFDRRNEFCEIMQIRYWAAENPHWMQEAHTQHAQKGRYLFKVKSDIL
ncbi:hypothetical protein NQ318_015690 [Aromia moschata]|uniref:Transposase n=1 Tax=Aromia moschata TaxID=1265417 RepID=A0AAV8YIY0_9CUCU|nr:hypothetical protein NQ318_015690 [Aromia moschata]